MEQIYTNDVVCDEKKDCLVTAVHKERYELEKDGRVIYARLKAARYFNGQADVPFPTVGDYVDIRYNEGGDSVIMETKPRKSVFLRLNPTPGMPNQAVAANFDYVFIVMSLNKDFHVTKLERYLSTAWQSGGTPVLILSKADICEDLSQYTQKAMAAAPGVDIIPISSRTGEGMAELEKYLEKGKMIVLLGSSGVGKSSLLNALMGEEDTDIPLPFWKLFPYKGTGMCRKAGISGRDAYAKDLGDVLRDAGGGSTCKRACRTDCKKVDEDETEVF